MRKDISVKEFNNLIKRIACCDEKAFGELYNIFSGFIYTTAIRMTGARALVEEIVDDVMVKIWNSASQQKKIENPYGWLYTITVNSAKDRIKFNKSYTEIFDIPADDKNLKHLEDNDAFHSMLSCMNDDEERVVKLHLEYDYTFKEIAKMENKCVSTISSVYYRAIEKVRIMVNKNSKKN